MDTLTLSQEGPQIGAEDSARDVIEEALNEGARLVAIPIERLDPGFLDLSTRMAGEFLQKMVNYRLKVAIIGDVTPFANESKALHDFIVECDRGGDIIFAPDADSLAAKLAQSA